MSEHLEQLITKYWKYERNWRIKWNQFKVWETLNWDEFLRKCCFRAFWSEKEVVSILLLNSLDEIWSLSINSEINFKHFVDNVINWSWECILDLDWSQQFWLVYDKWKIKITNVQWLLDPRAKWWWTSWDPRQDGDWFINHWWLNSRPSDAPSFDWWNRRHIKR